MLVLTCGIFQAPHERMAYRCSYCGIIFDSISHRERHEQRHKVSNTDDDSIILNVVFSRTMTLSSVKTVIKCSRMRRIWDITTRRITSYRTHGRKESGRRGKSIIWKRWDHILEWLNHYLTLAGEWQEGQKGATEVPLPHVRHPCHVCPHRSQVWNFIYFPALYICNIDIGQPRHSRSPAFFQADWLPTQFLRETYYYKSPTFLVSME